MSDSPLVRPAGPADAPALVDLFARAAGQRVTAEHLGWKYGARELPGSSGGRLDGLAWSFVGSEGGQLAFHYGGVPRTCTMGQVARVVTAGADAMTAPEARRRGWFARGAAFAQERWTEAGVAFSLGIPSPNWGSRTVALGWTPLQPIVSTLCPLSAAALTRARLLRAAGALAPLSGALALPLRAVDPAWSVWQERDRDPALELDELTSARDELDGLWARLASSDDRPRLTRDRAWVEHRYLRSPQVRYRVLAARRRGRLEAWAALRLARDGERTTGYLLDLAGDPGAARALVADVLAWLRAQGADKAQALVVPGSARAALLSRSGFWFPRDRLQVMIRPFDLALPLAALRDPARFELSGGDLDFT